MELIKQLDISRKNLLMGGVAGALLATYTEYSEVSGITFSHVIGKPTKTSATISIISDFACEVYLECGASQTPFGVRTSIKSLISGEPTVYDLTGLRSGSLIYYRLGVRRPKDSQFTPGSIYTFSTAKDSGKSFLFAVQGDSHPERVGKMNNAELYVLPTKNSSSQKPDLHILLEEGFSIDPFYG
jgi:hypothetical protein